MGLPLQVAAPVSKVLARLHRWYATAWVLAQVPLTSLDDTAIGRLRYALMMSNRIAQTQTHRLLHDIVVRHQNVSAELLVELSAMATSTGQPPLAADLLQQAMAAAHDPHTADAAGKLLRLNRTDADGTLQTTIQHMVESLLLPEKCQLTLVPVSGKYLELWRMWLQQVRQHLGGHIVAMAMDDAAATALSGEPDVAVVDVREFFSWNASGSLHPHTRGVLWYLRVLLLRDLVQRSHNVLVLDLDAMPVGDVNALLAGFEIADVIAQQDHSIPMDVERALGFVVCCGFMFWRPTAAACQLLEAFAAETAVERDDQLALNHLLFRKGIRPTKAKSGMQFQSGATLFACPNAAEVSRTALSGRVVRHFHQTGQSVETLQVALRS